MPSTGTRAAVNAGTSATMLPPGTPGTADDATTIAAATVARSVPESDTPPSRARNNTPTVCATAVPTWNTDTASGITRREVVASKPARSAACTIAGRVASEDRDANASACDGAR